MPELGLAVGLCSTLRILRSILISDLSWLEPASRVWMDCGSAALLA